MIALPLDAAPPPGVPPCPTEIQALSIVRSDDIATVTAPDVEAAIRGRTAGLLSHVKSPLTGDNQHMQLKRSSSREAEDGVSSSSMSGSSMHTAEVRAPLGVAHLLLHEPQLVAPAVEAFYRRDPPAMKVALHIPLHGCCCGPLVMGSLLFNCLNILHSCCFSARVWHSLFAQ